MNSQYFPSINKPNRGKLLNSESYYQVLNNFYMKTLGKILYWTLTVGLGFINPAISIALVVLYYLPRIIDDYTKQKNPPIDEYSDKVLHEMK
jgi:hypothetical protein